MRKLQERVTFDAATVRRLKSLVARGEGVHLEFKRKATYPEKIVREMVAFANTKGGTVLLGVDDNGEIPGLKFPEDESHVIHKALTDCFPSLELRESYIAIGNARTVIRFDVPESKRKAHYLMFNGVKQAFVRVADQSIRASHEMREILKRSQDLRDIRFPFGDVERLLMQHLDEFGTITLHQFMKLARLGRYSASRKLVKLVLADVLAVTPHEKGDVYSRVDDPA